MMHGAVRIHEPNRPLKRYLSRSAGPTGGSRRRVALATAAAISSTAMSAALGLTAPAVADAPASELYAAWTTSSLWQLNPIPDAAAVETGASLTGEFKYNLNSPPDGAAGSRANNVVSLKVDKAVFTTLPGECLTSGVTPASSLGDPVDVNGDGTMDGPTLLTCNLGAMDYATAKKVAFSLYVTGVKGEKVSLTATGDGIAEPVNLPKVPITSAPGVDVAIGDGGAGYLISGAAGRQWKIPLAVSLPVGAEWLDPAQPIEFDVRLKQNQDVANIGAVNALACENQTLNDSSLPKTGAVPLPPCVVTNPAPGVFHVRLTGYRPGPFADIALPQASATGGSLPADRVFLAALALRVQNANTLQTAAGDPIEVGNNIGLRVNNVSAVSAHSGPVTDSDSTNNDANLVIVSGGRSTAWDSDRLGGNNPLSGQGDQWSASRVVLPGSRIWGVSNNTNPMGSPQAQVPAGVNEWGACLVLGNERPRLSFTGELLTQSVNVGGDPTDMWSQFADSAIHFYVSTDGLGAAGSAARRGFDTAGPTTTGTRSTSPQLAARPPTTTTTASWPTPTPTGTR